MSLLYKKYILLVPILFFTAQVDAKTLKSPELFLHKITKNAVKTYNESLYNIKAQVDALATTDKEKKALQKILGSKSQLIKAELIGDTVYFKKSQKVIKFRVQEFVRTDLIKLVVNGNQIEMNPFNGFNKNNDIFKKTLQNKVGLSLEKIIELLLPSAMADIEIPEEFSEELLSVHYFFMRWFKSALEDLDTAYTELCEIGNQETESKLGQKTDAVLFSEIKTLVQTQEKYTRRTLTGTICGSYHGRLLDDVDTTNTQMYSRRECDKALKTQECIQEMAQKRRVVIENKQENGFSCFVTSKSAVNFLSPTILERGLEDYESSYTFLKTFDEANRGTTRYREAFGKYCSRYHLGVVDLSGDGSPCEKRLQKQIRDIKATTNQVSCGFLDEVRHEQTKSLR